MFEGDGCEGGMVHFHISINTAVSEVEVSNDAVHCPDTDVSNMLETT